MIDGNNEVHELYTLAQMAQAFAHSEKHISKAKPNLGKYTK